MALYRHEFVVCPHCGGETGSRVDHLYHDQLPCNFGPWSCGQCGKRYDGTVVAHGDVRFRKIDGAPERSRQMVLLKYDGGDRATFFVMDHPRYNPNGKRGSDEENQDHVRYFFESHSCPTNWLHECVAVIECGDTDPHGFLEFVRAVDVPQDFDADNDAAWLSIFPEAFSTDKQIEARQMSILIETSDAEWTTKIDALAQSLGVDPEPVGGRNDGQLRYLISVNNGQQAYNILDMVHRLIDRLDAATQK